MNGQTVAYIRVSSIDQNPDRQIAKVGDVDRTFTDRVSGKSRVDRPELANMLGHVRQGDLVRVASMDRLARSVVDLAQLVKDMTSRGVTVEFVSERLTFEPGAEDSYAMFHLHMLGAVAQLERSTIRERQQDGIDLAKKRGVYRGRSRKLTDEQIHNARQLIDVGVPKTKIAENFGCSRRVLYDALASRGPYSVPSL